MEKVLRDDESHTISGVQGLEVLRVDGGRARRETVGIGAVLCNENLRKLFDWRN